MHTATLFAFIILGLAAIIYAQDNCPGRAELPNCTLQPSRGIRGGNDCRIRAGRLWAWNPRRRRCVTINYLGCGGNANRFCTRETCENICRTARRTTRRSTRRPTRRTTRRPTTPRTTPRTTPEPTTTRGVVPPGFTVPAVTPPATTPLTVTRPAVTSSAVTSPAAVTPPAGPAGK